MILDQQVGINEDKKVINMHYLWMFIAGIIGIILHSLITIRKINKNIASETYASVFKKYWSLEWISLSISIFALIAAVFISSEFLNGDMDKPMPGNIGSLLQYKLIAYVRTTFLVIGYCADSAVVAFLGSAEEKLKAQAKQNGIPVD